MVSSNCVPLLSCLASLAAAELAGIKITHYMPGSKCEGDELADETHWEGCMTYTLDGDVRSFENIIDDDEWVRKHFDGPGCDEEEEEEKKEEKGDIDKCKDDKMYEEVEMEGEYFHIEVYEADNKDEGCPIKRLEGSMMVTEKDMKLGKCKETGTKKKYDMIEIEGNVMTLQRYGDKKCKEVHEDLPDPVTIKADGTCTAIPDLDEDDDEVIRYYKFWYTDKDGRTSLGHTMHLSLGVVAVTSLANLVATVI